MLFDKEGILNIDELVAQRPTFRKIMEDQIVTDDELNQPAILTIRHISQPMNALCFFMPPAYQKTPILNACAVQKKLEQTLSPGQLSEVENLLAEMSVLYAIHQYKEIQDLKL